MWHYRCGFCLYKLHVVCPSGAANAGQGDTSRSHNAGAGAAAATPGSSRATRIAKFLLRTSLNIAINAATGALATPVLDVLATALDDQE